MVPASKVPVTINPKAPPSSNPPSWPLGGAPNTETALLVRSLGAVLLSKQPESKIEWRQEKLRRKSESKTSSPKKTSTAAVCPQAFQRANPQPATDPSPTSSPVPNNPKG